MTTKKERNIRNHAPTPMYANKNIPYYLAAVALFVVLKFWFTLADNDSLDFLLKPTNKLVAILTGSHFYHTPNGYYHESLHMLIDKSCSGFNFWILCFLLFTYLMVRYFDKPLHKTLTIPVALVCAYLLSIFVNTSRIFAAIIIQHQTKNMLPDQQHLIHEAVGIVTNLSFLILAYYLIEKFLLHIRHNAKLV